MRVPGVIAFFLIFSFGLLAQTDSLEGVSEPFDFVSEEESGSFFEYITDLFTTGIHLNRASKADFLELDGFDEETAEKIIHYRRENGKFYSTGELYIIPGINQDIIRKYFSFFRVDEAWASGRIINGNLLYRQEKQFNNDLPASYPGSEFRQMLKADIRFPNDIQARFITEKDPGELSFTDHYTGFIHWRSTTMIRSLTAGSFILRSPAGLLSGAAYYIPFGSRISRFSPDIQVRGFSSSEENRFLLGGAAELELSGVTLTPFYSSNSYDGSLSSYNEYYSLFDGGYHRSITERRLRDGLKITSSGISANVTHSSGAGGSFTFYHQDLKSAVNRGVNNFASASLSASFYEFSALSELVYSSSGLNVVIHAGRKSTGKTPAGVYFRRLRENSLPVYANPYRESSYLYSETGGGLYFRINPFSLPLDIVTDVFSYHRKTEPVTLTGFRCMIKSEKRLNPSTVIKAVYSVRSKDKIISELLSQKNSTGARHSVSIIVQNYFSAEASVRNRLIYNVYDNTVTGSEDGFAYITEFRYQKEQYGIILGYSGFSGEMIETASYFSERTFLDYGLFKSLIGTGNYLYTSLFANLPFGFRLSLRAGLENKTSYDGLAVNSSNGSVILQYTW